MKAIIVSYDKYLRFANHTISRYQKQWPSNPFIFRVPYGEAKNLLDFTKYGNKVKLVQTDGAKVTYSAETSSESNLISPIKVTVLKLIEDIPDDEWIYWCMDDRYPIRIKDDKAKDIYEFVKNTVLPNLSCKF